MQWLNKFADEIVARYPEGEILIESGGSPSGTYHLGHMREVIICDAVVLELRRRGRQAKHIYFVDDLDALRKIPVNVPAEYEKYLGYPLCDIPAPDGSGQSYADFFLNDLVQGCKTLGIEVEFIPSHEKYRSGFFVPAIERALNHVAEARQVLETVSGRQLDPNWSPIQVVEDGRLKNRRYLSLNTDTKEVHYAVVDGAEQTIKYDAGMVKLDWRLDWPGRWWLLHVSAEPFGRDHASAGGSYDTGVQLMKHVYRAEAPLPIPYDFVNMAGDTKKMSASKGTGLNAVEGTKVLPPEVMRFFILRAAPNKRLYFDTYNSVVELMDEFAALAAKSDRNEEEEQLLYVCTRGVAEKTVSRVPFSHLVASYQTSLKDVDKTLAVIRRTEYAPIVDEDGEIIRAELKFIDEWLQRWAPETVKFQLQDKIDFSQFTETEQQFLHDLGKKIAAASADADGEWFHKAIYEFKDTLGLEPKDLFSTLYRALIGKTSGPRAGYFLSILPRDWLVKQLEG